MEKVTNTQKEKECIDRKKLKTLKRDDERGKDEYERVK